MVARLHKSNDESREACASFPDAVEIQAASTKGLFIPAARSNFDVCSDRSFGTFGCLFPIISLSEISPRRKLQSEDQYLEASGKATVIANDSSTYRDPHGLYVMDAKSLFDALNSEQSQGDDDRSALETAIISESLSACRGRLRWVPHNMNPANSMTKSVGGHHEPLLKLLQTRKYITEEVARQTI